MPHAVVIRAPGTNCDQELCRGFALAGAAVELVHLEALIRDPAPLAKADLLGVPGGFSYGDDIASGRIFAMKVRERLYAPLRDALARGVPVFAPCNGFQVAVQVGLLPGPAGSVWPENAAPAQEVALTDNIGGRFVDRWVPVEYPADAACVWTRGVLDHIPGDFKHDAALLPVAHGEGRFVAASPGVLSRLRGAGQVAVIYLDNYNGSVASIAGISDASGRVFGLMPHPERFLEWTRHPYWTRLPKDLLKLPTPGARMFMNAVEAASAAWVR
jgi:phosphoribosylformylglycinamidine synthase subunit PurQ / glutaminase